MGDDPPTWDRTWGGGQHRANIWISVRQTWRLLYGSWEYSPMELMIQKVEFEEVEAYVMRRQNTVAQYILTQPNIDL